MALEMSMDKTWITEEGKQGDWYWYSEGSGYTLVFNAPPYRIPSDITKWCHDNFTSYYMRYYPSQNSVNDELWLRSKKELTTFLLWWG